MNEEENKNFKLKKYLELEKTIRNKWENEHVFEQDAPENWNNDSRKKYLVTFPFPYMNGRLHLGHSFSLSKADFTIGFKRLTGYHCLFPFGFHATGMPIKACADKLKREIEVFGYPPKFILDDFEKSVKIEDDKELDIKNKAKGKKSKAQAKTGNLKYQWQIMESLGLTNKEIFDFQFEKTWLEYFPPLAIADLKLFGIQVDWRRSFITTDVNLFFDSFVKWQFLKLKELKLINYGKRYTIYSPKYNQPCMDHDRATGENVGPQEYCLIKLKLIDLNDKLISAINNSNLCQKVYLVAATLKPETMYGQTNCWIKPDLEYIVYKVLNKLDNETEIFISSRRSALNLSYQGFTVENGVIDTLCSLVGSDLISCKLKPPLSFYNFIYVLPMFTINDDKGTGIVTSVPSDSPDDYAALKDLKTKTALRKKYNLEDEMVLPFDPIPIIKIEEYGDLSAKKICEQMKIDSQNDSDKLAIAKEKLYLKGFYEGILLVGDYKDQKVINARAKIQKDLLEQNSLVIYMEPEKKVISRSGDECVVALCNQWYLDYGNENWREITKKALDSLNTHSIEVKRNFESVINWLHEYACARNYGLGSKLPWDTSWLIESLSDSTIYMAYYTIAHLLQQGTLTAETSNLEVKEFTPALWDYIFLKDSVYPVECKLPKEFVEKLKNEFNYWYPVDLRTSGKDLISNHLTFALYNHCAIWKNEPDKWIKSIRANGHLLLNNEKMSKSTGNFLTLEEAILKYSSDGVRLALADAGDGIEDANFVEKQANSGFLRLYNFYEWTKNILKEELPNMREDYNKNYFADYVFDNQMKYLIKQTERHYENKMFKEALKTCFFEYHAIRDKYRELCISTNNMSKKLILKFIETQAIILSPICPHLSEAIWQLIYEKESIFNQKWPHVEEINEILYKSFTYLFNTCHSFRLRKDLFDNNLRKLKKNSEQFSIKANIYVAKDFVKWQKVIVDSIKDLYLSNNRTLPENKILSQKLIKLPELAKHKKKMMSFAEERKRLFAESGEIVFDKACLIDEKDILSKNIDYLKHTLDVKQVVVNYSHEHADEKILNDCCPLEPLIFFETEA